MSAGALACLVDSSGRTAADFARLKGHSTWRCVLVVVCSFPGGVTVRGAVCLLARGSHHARPATRCSGVLRATAWYRLGVLCLCGRRTKLWPPVCTAALARRLESQRQSELASIRDSEVAAGREDPGSSTGAGHSEEGGEGEGDEEMYDYYVVSAPAPTPGIGAGAEAGPGAVAEAAPGVTARVAVEGLDESDSDDDSWYDQDAASR